MVATNQPDVGRGDQAQSVVESMHARLRELVPSLEHIEVCYAPGQGRAHPEDYRRKPEPGMITDAAKILGLDLSRSWDGRRTGGATSTAVNAPASAPSSSTSATPRELRAAPDYTVKTFPRPPRSSSGPPPRSTKSLARLPSRNLTLDKTIL